MLLKPDKKRKNDPAHHVPDTSKIPKHLQNMAMKEFPPETCPWSLSGPQFPKPTAIQQRYCYPKGDPAYSTRKGGALWTMYGVDGKEDLEFRLLHVYFSAKRAVNQGIQIPVDELQRATDASNQTVGVAGPAIKKRAAGKNKRPKASNARRAAAASKLPVGVGAGAALQPLAKTGTSAVASKRDPNGKSNFVSPHVAASITDQGAVIANATALQQSLGVPDLNHAPGGQVQGFYVDNQQDQDILESTFQVDLERDNWHHDEESMYAIVMKPSFDRAVEAQEPAVDPPAFSSVPGPLTTRALKKRLKRFHEQLCDDIILSPVSEQGPCLEILSRWARNVSAQPFGSGRYSELRRRSRSSSGETGNVDHDPSTASSAPAGDTGTTEAV